MEISTEVEVLVTLSTFVDKDVAEVQAIDLVPIPSSTLPGIVPVGFIPKCSSVPNAEATSATASCEEVAGGEGTIVELRKGEVLARAKSRRTEVNTGSF